AAPARHERIGTACARLARGLPLVAPTPTSPPAVDRLGLVPWWQAHAERGHAASPRSARSLPVRTWCPGVRAARGRERYVAPAGTSPARVMRCMRRRWPA